MADTLLLKALRGNARKVKLNNKNLKAIPRLVGKLSELDTLEARNNKICYLPSEMALLVKVSSQSRLALINKHDNKYFNMI